MKFTSVSLVLAYGIAVMASPALVERQLTASSELEEYTEHYREPAALSDGHLVYYGPSRSTTSASAPATIQARGGTCESDVAPNCSSSHAARNDVCTALVTELYNDAETAVPQSPRQICYEGGGEDDNPYCCVSWHNVVGNLTKGDLAPIANRMLVTCTANGISGKTGNVMVSETCTAVCLSNRGTHC